jgi:hypothetical protein
MQAGLLRSKGKAHNEKAILPPNCVRAFSDLCLIVLLWWSLHSLWWPSILPTSDGRQGDDAKAKAMGCIDAKAKFIEGSTAFIESQASGAFTLEESRKRMDQGSKPKNQASGPQS